MRCCDWAQENYVWQEAEKVRQQRSRLIEILNVPQRVRLRFRLACGLAWDKARLGAQGLGG
jgi:hypothetical protein